MGAKIMIKYLSMLLCIFFFSCKTGSIVKYENLDFSEEGIKELCTEDNQRNVFLFSTIQYSINGTYDLIFHFFSRTDNFFDNYEIESITLYDEYNNILFIKDLITADLHDTEPSINSLNKLYEKVLWVEDCFLTREEIQQNKKQYLLEYSINGKKVYEKLIRREKKYLLTAT